MEIEEQCEKLLELSANAGSFPESRERDLMEALYSYDERGLLMDVSVDFRLALRLWALVERVKNEGFPQELRM